MNKGDNVTKHIHKFKFLLQWFVVVRILVENDNFVVSLMKSMLTSYKFFISSL